MRCYHSQQVEYRKHGQCTMTRCSHLSFTNRLRQSDEPKFMLREYTERIYAAGKPCKVIASHKGTPMPDSNQESLRICREWQSWMVVAKPIRNETESSEPLHLRHSVTLHCSIALTCSHCGAVRVNLVHHRFHHTCMCTTSLSLPTPLDRAHHDSLLTLARSSTRPESAGRCLKILLRHHGYVNRVFSFVIRLTLSSQVKPKPKLDAMPQEILEKILGFAIPERVTIVATHQCHCSARAYAARWHPARWHGTPDWQQCCPFYWRDGHQSVYPNPLICKYDPCSVLLISKGIRRNASEILWQRIEFKCWARYGWFLANHMDNFVEDKVRDHFEKILTREGI
jgi:hypothetical protein